MKDKIFFRYDKNTKKGIIKTEKGEFKIDLDEQHLSNEDNEKTCSGSGSGGCGYGIHLI